MDTATTSLAPANSLRGEWARFGAFLKRPTLPGGAPAPNAASLAATLRMLGLDFLVMFVLLAIAGAVMSAGIELPETALAGMDLEAGLIVFAVVAAPVLEETVFRGWLSGRPGHILAVAILVLGTLVLTQTGLTQSDAQVNLKAIGGFAAMLVGAIVAAFALRGRPPFAWFARLFPLFYWLSTVGFACVHLYNFEGGNPAVLLPLVLPQFATGAILGYVRVNYGLWLSILLHILHNAAFISLVLLASEAAG